MVIFVFKIGHSFFNSRYWTQVIQIVWADFFSFFFAFPGKNSWGKSAICPYVAGFSPLFHAKMVAFGGSLTKKAVE